MIFKDFVGITDRYYGVFHLTYIIVQVKLVSRD